MTTSSGLRFLVVLSMSLACAAASAGVRAKHQIPGQSLDDGVGDLPHYAHWYDPTGKSPMRVNIPGEKLDSGLGAFVDLLDAEYAQPLPVRSASSKSDKRK